MALAFPAPASPRVTPGASSGKVSSEMPRRHLVIDGDCIESIAFQYGFFPSTLWDHPDNSELRELRGNPHVLSPGDEVFIPDLREKEIEAATGKKHRFRRRGVPAKLRVRLEEGGEPRAGVKYTLQIDGGPTVSGAADQGGLIERWVSPSATGALLSLEDGEVYSLRLGRLRPSDDRAGIGARLANLGYGEIADDDLLASALGEFQRDHGLEETREADESTVERLRSEHGS